MEKLEKDSQRILEIKYFTNKYNWKGINFLTEIKECKNFEKIIQQLHIFCQKQSRRNKTILHFET